MNSIANIEIFRAGTWNGDKYTVEDLDDMVANFDRVGFNVPVKLGHTDDSGEPAYGWVESIRRVGDRLLATIVDLPGKIYEAICNRRFDAVSCEVVWNLRRNGETYRRALAAIALLGAELPAVSGLKPLRDSLRGLTEAEWNAVRAYTTSSMEIEMNFIPKYTMAGEPGREVDAQARKLCIERSISYEEAMTAVLSDPRNYELKHAFASLG